MSSQGQTHPFGTYAHTNVQITQIFKMQSDVQHVFQVINKLAKVQKFLIFLK